MIQNELVMVNEVIMRYLVSTERSYASSQPICQPHDEPEGYLFRCLESEINNFISLAHKILRLQGLMIREGWTKNKYYPGQAT